MCMNNKFKIYTFSLYRIYFTFIICVICVTCFFRILFDNSNVNYNANHKALKT